MYILYRVRRIGKKNASYFGYICWWILKSFVMNVLSTEPDANIK